MFLRFSFLFYFTFCATLKVLPQQLLLGLFWNFYIDLSNLTGLFINTFFRFLAPMMIDSDILRRCRDSLPFLSFVKLFRQCTNLLVVITKY